MVKLNQWNCERLGTKWGQTRQVPLTCVNIKARENQPIHNNTTKSKSLTVFSFTAKTLTRFIFTYVFLRKPLILFARIFQCFHFLFTLILHLLIFVYLVRIRWNVVFLQIICLLIRILYHHNTTALFYNFEVMVT